MVTGSLVSRWLHTLTQLIGTNIKTFNDLLEKKKYVEGLEHNMFSIGQFCDKDLEVNFLSKKCVVRMYEGNEKLTGKRRFNLYTISLTNLKVSKNVYHI